MSPTIGGKKNLLARRMGVSLQPDMPTSIGSRVFFLSRMRFPASNPRFGFRPAGNISASGAWPFFWGSTRRPRK